MLNQGGEAVEKGVIRLMELPTRGYNILINFSNQENELTKDAELVIDVEVSSIIPS